MSEDLACSDIWETWILFPDLVFWVVMPCGPATPQFTAENLESHESIIIYIEIVSYVSATMHWERMYGGYMYYNGVKTLCTSDLHTSLSSVLIYCRYICTVTKLISPSLYYKVINYLSQCFNLNISHIECVSNRNCVT
jgi:hypothetical protein